MSGGPSFMFRSHLIVKPWVSLNSHSHSTKRLWALIPLGTQFTMERMLSLRSWKKHVHSQGVWHWKSWKVLTYAPVGHKDTNDIQIPPQPLRAHSCCKNLSSEVISNILNSLLRSTVPLVTHVPRNLFLPSCFVWLSPLQSSHFSLSLACVPY